MNAVRIICRRWRTAQARREQDADNGGHGGSGSTFARQPRDEGRYKISVCILYTIAHLHWHGVMGMVRVGRVILCEGFLF